MKWIALTLVAAATGGLFATQFGQGQSRPASEIATPALLPQDTGARQYLTPAQQRQASAEGGFGEVPRSLLRIDRRMQYGDFEWNDEGVPAGPITIRVDLRTQLLSVFRGGHEIGTAVALYGADSKETPLGRFPILWKGRDHRSSLYDAPMPFTLRLTGDGIAIHGSNVRWGAATHGCIGVPTDFAAHLFQASRTGDLVSIVRTAAPS